MHVRPIIAVVLALLTLLCSRANAVYLIVDTHTGYIRELNVFSLPDLIDYARQQQEEGANPNIWPDVSYNSNIATCTNTISAQYIASTDVYTIPQWYYHSYHDFVAVVVNIIDLRAAVAAASYLHVWDGQPDCEELWNRINNQLITPLINTALFRQNMAIQDLNTGIEVEMLCGEVLCTVDLLMHTLKTRQEHVNFGVQIV